MGSESEGWSQRPLAADTAGPVDGLASERGLSNTSDFDPVEAYLERLGSGSRRTMREALTKLADWASDGRAGPQELPWHLLRIEHTAALRTRLASQLAPATANKHLAALRGVLKQCWRQGTMTAEAYQRAIDLPPVRGGAPRKLRRLGAPELQRLTTTCRGDVSPAGARDEALIAMLCEANLRRSEAVSLDLEDYDLHGGVITVRGAGSRPERRHVADEDTRRALDRWLLVRGAAAGPLFNPVNKGGRIERRRLSEQAIYIACQKRAAESGLPPTSPEDLRRADPRQDAAPGPLETAGSPSPA